MNYISSRTKKLIVLFKTEGTFANHLKHNSLFYFGNFFIQLLTTPFLTRIYAPEAYGTFTIINSIAFYLTLVFTLQTEPSIILVKDEARMIKSVNRLFSLVFYSFLLSNILFGLFYLISRNGFVHSKIEISHLFLASVVAFVLAVNNVFGNISNWYKSYKRVFRIGTPFYFAGKLFSIGWGKLVSKGFWGLYFGEIIIRIATILVGFPFIIKRRIFAFFKLTSFRALFHYIRSNKKYAFYELPSRFILNFSSQIPLFYLIARYSKYEVGQYSLTVTLLEVPIRLISYSVGAVFFKKVSELKNEGKGLYNKSKLLLGGLALTGIVPFLLFYLFAGSVFTFVFGSKWELAGKLCSSLALFFYARFVCDPFVVLLRIVDRQKIILISSAVLIAVQVSFFYTVDRLHWNLLNIMTGFSFLGLVYYASLISAIFFFVKRSEKLIKINATNGVTG
jgi:O-antigen/teichoic acid export membrane protein